MEFQNTESAEKYGNASVSAVAWKWDGTPVPAFIRAEALQKHIGRDSAEAQTLEELEIDGTILGKGVECFCQRGIYLYM